MPNLPDEIIFDILLRLPVVSLCRFRCVSKPWRSLISHPRFIRTHLNRNTHNKHKRLIVRYGWDLYSVDLESSPFGDESVAVPLRFPTEQNARDCCYEICGSCDGLVLIGFRIIDCVHYSLVNPSTKEFRILPQSPFKLHQWRIFNYYGLGYDSSSDDYKVVSFHEEDKPTDVVTVYSLRTNSWKKIGNPPYCHSEFVHKSGVFVGGALHWMANTGTGDSVVALDLADEKFCIVPSPGSVGATELTALGGCLCVSRKRFYESHVDVWVMKDYGVGDSWTKFRVAWDNFGDSWSPLSSSRTDQVLFIVNTNTLVFFDPQEEKSKELVVRGHSTDFEAKICVESLVSPYRHV